MFTFGEYLTDWEGGRNLHIIMFINWLLPVKVHADDLMDQTARYKNSESLSYLKKQQKNNLLNFVWTPPGPRWLLIVW